MFNKVRVLRLITTTLLISFFLTPLRAGAAETAYQNPTTSFEVLIEDDADLLTQDEESVVLEQMKGITKYGNVVFKSISENPKSTTARYAEQFYISNFKYKDGTLLLIDMDERMIYIYSSGAVSDIITDSYSDIITDNIYTYASDGDYCECVRQAFEQIDALLNGYKIAKPMKYISNAFFAIILALLINYFITELMSRPRKPTVKEQMEAVSIKCDISDPGTTFIKETKRYVGSSSSGSGRRGGGGGRRSGGGGHRSSGGGHRF